MKTIAGADFVDKSTFLGTPLHLLWDKRLMNLFESASKTSWQNRICYSTKASVKVTNVFGLTVEIKPIFADILILVLTRPTVLFHSLLGN